MKFLIIFFKKSYQYILDISIYTNNMDNLSIAAFANDIVLFSTSEISISELIKTTTQQLFKLAWLLIRTNLK